MAALILGCALVMLLDALLAPYTFYYGGHLHIVPGWQGQGWIRSTAAGGDYFFWLRIEPTTPGYRKSDIKAIGYLCTPKGDRFRLSVGGMWPRDHPTNTIGVPVHLYMSNTRTFAQFTGDRRPKLDFYGSFADRALVLEDRGSLTNAFRPDGTLYPPTDHSRRRKETVQFTLSESSLWTLGPACPARRD